MKGLTVQQPWAWAIFNGKDVENRTTLWKHRGPVAIHAGKRISERGIWSPLVGAAWDRTSNYALEEARDEDWERGAIIGVVNVVDAHWCADGCCTSEWAESAYREHKGRMRGDIAHMVLADPVEIDPVPVGGALGLWTLPPAVMLAVRAQYEANTAALGRRDANGYDPSGLV